ncbi:hypothetical protein [Acinetobacter modestus]|uniref:Transposase n=1 Tax=Acinetobacter modestus TaxID=1776740 RepID=A0ABN0JRX7_9GAMM|nr:hypothetical protein [Acinetobacter modestus]ENU27957.1 hypothetical protein F992_00789 [Acinetobacter modestus]GGA21385.1 hypothetical protein GCM10017554_18020 [Acinetobacter modestus]
MFLINTNISLNLKSRGFKKNELNLTLLKIWERQIINGHTPYKSNRKGSKVSSGNNRVRAKNTPTQIRTKKNDRKYFRDLNYKESLLFTMTRKLKEAQNIVNEVNQYGSNGFTYNFDDGLSVDPLIFKRLPEPLKTRVLNEIKSINRLFQISYELELQTRLYNAYFYLMEMKWQKYKILNIPLTEARISAQEWREYALNEIICCQGAIIKIENNLITRGQFIYYYHNDTQYIMSDVEKQGERLFLKDDYKISFSEWLKTDRSISLEMSDLNLTFPFNGLICKKQAQY